MIHVLITYIKEDLTIPLVDDNLCVLLIIMNRNEREIFRKREFTWSYRSSNNEELGG